MAYRDAVPLLTDMYNSGHPEVTSQWYLVVSQTGIFIEERYPTDGMPSREFNGEKRGYEIGCTFLTVDSDWLADQLEPGSAIHVLIDRVMAGLMVKWDGNNHRGTLDTDARLANDELESLLLDCPGEFNEG